MPKPTNTLKKKHSLEASLKAQQNGSQDSLRCLSNPMLISVKSRRASRRQPSHSLKACGKKSKIRLPKSTKRLKVEQFNHMLLMIRKFTKKMAMVKFKKLRMTKQKVMVMKKLKQMEMLLFILLKNPLNNHPVKQVPAPMLASGPRKSARRKLTNTWLNQVSGNQIFTERSTTQGRP